jgi:hypothetical protein
MGFCCGSCGFRSNRSELFIEQRGRERRRRCLCCGPRSIDRRRNKSLGALALYSLLAILGLVFWRELSNMGLYFLFMVLMFPASVVAAIIHEFGHAAATWLVGCRVYSITIGLGRPLFTFRFSRFDLEIAANPFWGGQIITFYGGRTPRRWKRASILIGGVVAQAIACGALLVLMAVLDNSGIITGDHFGSTLLALAFLALVVSLALQAVYNLWPLTIRRGEQRLGSDGRQLLGLIFHRQYRDQAALTDAYLTGRSLMREGNRQAALAQFEAGWRGIGNPLLFTCLIDCMGKTTGPKAATQLYFDNLDRMPPPDGFGPEWIFAMGNVAWHAVLAQRPEWRGLADELSKRAWDQYPEGAIKATRGAVLMLKGEQAVGEAMIRTALSGCTEAEDKAEFCDFLARQKLEQGESELAAEFTRMSQHLGRAA